MILLDANILIALTNFQSPEHLTVAAAVAALHRSGRSPAIGLQVLSEAWAVMTRPVVPGQGRPGLGWDFATAQRRRDWLLQHLHSLAELPTALQDWRRLVDQHQVMGVNTHDCRLASFMQAHRVLELLTFNVKDFTRFPFITVLTPAKILAGP